MARQNSLRPATETTVSLARYVLDREPFQASRSLDFCSERELVKQIGHAADQWPLVVLKELTDNALDAAEETGTSPMVRIEVSKTAIGAHWRARRNCWKW